MEFAQPAQAALWFLIPAVPIGIWVAFNDMARMKIPNLAVLALLISYAVLGLFALPLDAYLWRYAHFAVILIIGFLANMLGAMGAGDAKFAAAMAPFVALADASLMAYILAAATVLGFAGHRIARASSALRARTPDWVSWTHRKFPMGLCLGTGLIAFLALNAVYGP
ncbi:MAG: hypothetical protein CSA72_00055 [Rhodobacterales bacterium]|nr:MAG: hypothetical protein CR993_00380 [Rhodobacterales bacterium]PIE12689.1 MAG: hypothetical protein CSA72_00055 [Rhodobacterales bacterium]